MAPKQIKHNRIYKNILTVSVFFIFLSIWPMSALAASSYGSGTYNTGAYSVASPSSDGLPIGFTDAPSVPSGGLNISVPGGSSLSSSANTATNRLVTLSFNAGSDVKRMAISFTGDFSDASQEDYASTKQVDLCSTYGGSVKATDCPNGTYTIYVKFYTQYGIASDVITQTINLNSDTTSATSAGDSKVSSTTSAGDSNTFVAKEKTLTKKISSSLSEKLSGRILLQVEEKGEAWYVNPINDSKYYLGRPADAFAVMRALGLGISDRDYSSFEGQAPSRLAGRILLRVESHGEAYYVNPLDLKMHYLGRPADAFSIMRGLGLGITNTDLRRIGIGEVK